MDIGKVEFAFSFFSVGELIFKLIPERGDMSCEKIVLLVYMQIIIRKKYFIIQLVRKIIYADH